MSHTAKFLFLRPAAGRWPQLSAGLLGLLLVLGSCQHDAASPDHAAQMEQSIRAAEAAKVARTAAGPILSRRHDGGLYFDERYLDSIDAGPPYSARTLREKEIDKMLGWLDLVQMPIPSDFGEHENPNDSTSLSSGSETIQFANRQQKLKYIYHRIDSLKILENIPLTPH